MVQSDYDKNRSGCIPMSSINPNYNHHSENFRPEYKRRQVEHSTAFYEQMMRHDWHRKAGGKIRQRGWGR